MLELPVRLARSIPATQDERDATKWNLAAAVSFDDREVESAVFRFGDGTSQAVPPSMFRRDRVATPLVADARMRRIVVASSGWASARLPMDSD
jgi:hypothetical protein